MAVTKEEIIEALKGMTALELRDLVKLVETTFDVSAAAPVMVAGGAAEAAPVEEEKTNFDVVLDGFGDNKIAVIKVVRELTGLGLKEAKEAVEKGGVLIEGAAKDKAEEAKAKIEAVGGAASLK
ncbi:MAG: 50S ribosomal protein L7/L12 [Coriobacteriales bacterium]|nr:50S ribosomal protein L7/L12 [Coriobacteriales bacterium]MBQ6586604.1 50S ribosomal protein L7/L12 [Coriobacteriales bacterium]